MCPWAHWAAMNAASVLFVADGAPLLSCCSCVALRVWLQAGGYRHLQQHSRHSTMPAVEHNHTVRPGSSDATRLINSNINSGSSSVSVPVCLV